MVGSYLFAQQDNNNGDWLIDWNAQWHEATSDAIAAFWEQAVNTYIKISPANPNLTFEDFMNEQNLYNNDPNALVPILQGGNWNFLYGGVLEPSNCAPGFGGVCCGTSPSLHYSDKPELAGYVHLDTANPSAWFGFGSIVHLGVDMVLGNTIFANGIPRR